MFAQKIGLKILEYSEVKSKIHFEAETFNTVKSDTSGKNNEYKDNTEIDNYYANDQMVNSNMFDVFVIGYNGQKNSSSLLKIKNDHSRPLP